MQVTVLRHLPGEGIGVLRPVLTERGARITEVDMPIEGCRGLDPEGPDLLLIMGGPLGVNDRDAFPFLDDEIELVRRRLAADRPTFGVCLGAQVMAAALGGEVVRAKQPEIGWIPLELSPAASSTCLRHFTPETPVMHWHGDQFSLPGNVEHLARTPISPNQAFARGNNVLALQFHPEVRAEDLEYWYVGAIDSVRALPGLTVPGLREDAQRYAASAGRAAQAMLAEWLDQADL